MKNLKVVPQKSNLHKIKKMALTLLSQLNKEIFPSIYFFYSNRLKLEI